MKANDSEHAGSSQPGLPAGRDVMAGPLSIWDDTLTAAELLDLQQQLGRQPTQA